MDLNLPDEFPSFDGQPWGPGDFPVDDFELSVDVVPAGSEVVPGFRVGLPLGDVRSVGGVTEDPGGNLVALDLARWRDQPDDALVIIKYAPRAA